MPFRVKPLTKNSPLLFEISKISVKNDEELYYKVLKTAQETNKRPYRDWETDRKSVV